MIAFLDTVVRLFRAAPAAASRFAEMDATDADDEMLAAAGRAAIQEATRLFELDVVDPKATENSARASYCRRVIEDILRAAGWGWATPYRGNEKGAVQWCGLFAAACWRTAGIDPKWLATFWASTIRLQAWVNYKPFQGKPNQLPKTGTRRLATKITRKTKALPFMPRPGDILVVGDGHPSAGDHITLVERYNAERRVFFTIEGNGGGLGPDGKRREGIVRAERPIDGIGYVAMWLYRPARCDLLDWHA